MIWYDVAVGIEMIETLNRWMFEMMEKYSFLVIKSSIQRANEKWCKPKLSYLMNLYIPKNDLSILMI